MASKTSQHQLFLLVIASSAVIFQIAYAGDPDITSDFLGPHKAKAKYFTYTGLRDFFGKKAPEPKGFAATKVSKAEFPALDGQSVSFAILQYPPGTPNPPHTHPRSAELLLLTQGTLEVGFIDSTNTLYSQTLKPGDMFVFPKGLVHYQYNPDPKKTALALSSFGSASAGTVSIPTTLFTSGIPDVVLSKSLKTNAKTIQAIKKAFSATGEN